jgi:hypothetical protein
MSAIVFSSFSNFPTTIEKKEREREKLMMNISREVWNLMPSISSNSARRKGRGMGVGTWK